MVTGLDFSSGITTAPLAAALAVNAGDDEGAGVLEAFAFLVEAGGGASALPAGEGLGVGVAAALFA